MSELPDTQSQLPKYMISIDKVGVINLRKRIKILHGSKAYEFSPLISAFVMLPKQQRGIHMSRSSETVEEVIDELSYHAYPSLERVCEVMAETLLAKHGYSARSEVTSKGILVVDSFQEGFGKRQKGYEVFSKAVSTRSQSTHTTQLFLGASAEGMTTCPCAKELMQSYAKDILLERKDYFELEPKKIDDLLNIIPIASHSQRSKGTLCIELSHDREIDLLTITDIIESSMSGMVQDVLKRPDEGKLVRLAHLNPLFVEDSLRLMAQKVVEQLSFLTDSTQLSLRIENMESVHVYNACAEKTCSLGELKKEFQEVKNS
ncbi:MAG: GTP cyclohydrolase I FolE2 [Promethearchaeota archaeon]|nr:MAG: GTP cyclohydrolase I FolE2 [Candidatus Lokiarchaeota archaeon]